MPDHRMPDGNISDDLDRRIRYLVARAVADTPAPPDVSHRDSDVDIEPTEPDHRRGRYGSGLTLAAAAALVIIFIMIASGSDPADTPATEPVVTTLPGPLPPAPAIAPSDADPDGQTDPPDAILSFGPDGVVMHVDGEDLRYTDEAMSNALDLGDGRVLAQRNTGSNGPGDDAATAPLVLAEGGSPSPLFDTVDWHGAVTIHDVEVVERRTLLLYSLSTWEENSDDATEVLYAVDLDSGDRLPPIATISTPERPGGSGRLRLATTGLIIGSGMIDGVPNRLHAYAIPGSPADDEGVPTPADLGLKLGDADCRTCSRSMTIAPDGDTFAWLEDDKLVVRTRSGSYDQNFELAQSPASYLELEIGGHRVALSASAAGEPGLVFELDDLMAAPSPIDGYGATFGPAASMPDLVRPLVVDDVVTAGPGGVIAYQSGAGRLVTTQPMEMAIAIGDGRYLVQRRAAATTDPAASPSDTLPLILEADGTLGPLWATPPREWITLHDIERIDGRLTVLYTSSETQPADDGGGTDTDIHTTALDAPQADAPVADVVSAGTAVWRLHLACNGLIVGESRSAAGRAIAIYVIPGSPADTDQRLSAESLDLQPTYDCDDCPRLFGVSPHGAYISWLDGDANGGGPMLVRRATNRDPAPAPFNPFGTEVDMTRVADLDVMAEGALLVSYEPDESGEPPPPVFISGDGTVTKLQGTIATADPTGS